MSIDTGLYLSHRWNIKDVADVIEAYLGVKPEVTPTSISGYSTITFTYKGEARQMNYHYNSETPLGNLVNINIGKWGHADEIIKAIGEVLGGLYFADDSDCQYEFIYCKIDECDGLSFHLKYAIANDKAKNLKDVAKSIRNWNRKVNKCSGNSNELIGDSKFGTNLV